MVPANIYFSVLKWTKDIYRYLFLPMCPWSAHIKMHIDVFSFNIIPLTLSVIRHQDEEINVRLKMRLYGGIIS